MVGEVRRAGGILAPSKFWADFSARNLVTLTGDGGVETFKRCVNNNYFQWVILNQRHPDYRAVLREWRRHRTLAPLLAHVERDARGWFDQDLAQELPSPPRWIQPRAYALYVALLWEIACRRAPPGLGEGLEEPLLGRPVGVRHRRRRISQDLANSLLEYAAVAEGMSAQRRSTARVLEIGGGYGRLAWLWLAAHPGVRVVMVDIPPALALAQEYLTRLFPARRAALFRAGADLRALHADVLASDIAFLTPNQLDALDPLGADVALNVSSLHEMTTDQAARYLELIDRHASGGFFYTKQWRRWENPLDGVVAAREAHPYPERWQAVFDRVHPVQVRFFETLFAL